MKCLCPLPMRNRVGEVVRVPCGQCIACRLNYGKLWSIRMMEELKHHDKACFATLTYDEEHLGYICEDYGSPVLVMRDLQLFFKRLRKRVCKDTYVEPETGLLKLKNPIRYFACGEYGDRFGRPHYHAIIYGVSSDEVDLVSSCWKQGHIKLGTVTPDSCSYVAKYMTKKLRGKALDDKLAEDPSYQNEFVLMSRRPGIGSDLSPEMVRFLRDNGFIWRKGHRSGLPRYYKEKYWIPSKKFDEDRDVLEKHLNNLEINDKIIRKRLDFYSTKK